VTGPAGIQPDFPDQPDPGGALALFPQLLGGDGGDDQRVHGSSSLLLSSLAVTARRHRNSSGVMR
jgi:hypothetical protein